MTQAGRTAQLAYVRVLRKRYDVALVLLGAVALAMFALVLRVTRDDAMRPFLVGVAILGAIASAATALFSGLSRAEVGALHASSKGVDVAGERVVDAASILRAYVVPQTRGAMVRFVRRGLASDVGIEVYELEQARAILRAIGKDPQHVATSFRIRSSSSKTYRRRLTAAFVLVAAIPVLGVTNGAAVSSILALLALGALATAIVPAWIVIGADGVLLRGIFRRKFVPLREIASVDVDVDRLVVRTDAAIVRITTRSGERHEAVARAWDSRYDGMAQGAVEHARVIAERIEDALATRGDAVRASSVASILARSSRPFGAWARLLRAAMNERETFRTEALDPESLWRVVEDATEETTKRAAAAVALGPHLDDEGRARLRIAAESSAAPHLRLALEAAAEDDTEKIASALEEVERATSSPSAPA